MRKKQAWDFIPEVWSLPSLLVIPQRSQRALHLEVSESVLQPTPPRQMFSWGRGGGCFSPSDQRLCLLPGECRARRGEGKKMVNERCDAVLSQTQSKTTQTRGLLIEPLSPQISYTSLAGPPPPPPPLHFVWGQPGAVCTPCCLQLLQALLQVYCQAHFLGFLPVPLSHVTLQGPGASKGN